MSKVKNAELEERALEVADKLLLVIENQVERLDKQKDIDVKKLKNLIAAYNTLKPYF